MFLRHVPPMGIYETLYAFLGSFGSYMGEPGTHPWSQGFPRTDKLPSGPELPRSVQVESEDLRYPKAWGLPSLRDAIARYYRTSYGSDISADNIMVFAGGRPAIAALLLFLDSDISIRIAETEYTPYFDLLKCLRRDYSLVESSVDNVFKPPVASYANDSIDGRTLMMLSNPCNPTGVTRTGADLKSLVNATNADRGLLVDEAYELFHDEPVSALRYIKDIDESNVFVIGAATKGLQAPGIRIGWVVAAKQHIEILGNFSSFGMGGVSHPSQCYAVALFEEERMALARTAVPDFYGSQRARYRVAFESLGLDLFSGEGGFYHWCRLPGGVSAEDLNSRLFQEGAAVLKGVDCDMLRRGDDSPLRSFFRFSFGPLAPESFESDINILERAIRALT